MPPTRLAYGHTRSLKLFGYAGSGGLNCLGMLVDERKQAALLSLQRCEHRGMPHASIGSLQNTGIAVTVDVLLDHAVKLRGFFVASHCHIVVKHYWFMQYIVVTGCLSPYYGKVLFSTPILSGKPYGSIVFHRVIVL